MWNQEGNFSDIYAQKIGWDGEAQWESNGTPISIEENDQSAISFDIDENAFSSISKEMADWSFSSIDIGVPLLSH